jgi:hypothetical protein
MKSRRRVVISGIRYQGADIREQEAGTAKSDLWPASAEASRKEPEEKIRSLASLG